MATKANLISAVNGFLTAIITQSKVRDAQLEVIDELYPSAVTDNSTDETYTTQTTPTVTYAIQITKQGRSVRINGTYTNTTGLALPAGTEIFAFKTNEFRGSTSEFIGENVIYTPYKLNSRGSIAPFIGTKFEIIINSND
jgi:hypothetical protein